MSNGLTSALNGKSLLMTGVSGFLGKVVLEKILRSVPDVSRIYLVIRPNSQYRTAENRFYQEIACSSIFDKLKASQSVNFAELCHRKLRFVTGEITEPAFGLSAGEFGQLGQSIDLIINSAASVDFREPLDSALRINALSLLQVARLARERKIPVVQVSTCYVNGFNRGVITEDIWGPAKLPLHKSISGYYEVDGLIHRLHQQIEDIYRRGLSAKEQEQALVELGVRESRNAGWNDSYTFTKWIGEQLLLKELKGQSLTIVRPAIIESTLKGPVPGWIEGVKVADAIILAYAREKISIFPGNKNAVLDIIPADLVANSIILAASEAAIAPTAHRIYQCGSSEANPVRIREMIAHVQEAAEQRHDHYGNLFLRKPERSFAMVPSFAFNSIIYSSYQAVKIKNKLAAGLNQSSSLKTQKNLETAIQLSSIFSFYTQPRYTFSNRKLVSLANQADNRDRQEFPVNATEVNWKEYLSHIHIAGLDRYALRPRREVAKPEVTKRTAEVA
ncbi:MAG: fatty acyl-CoA reductase [Ketobacteraceae bacterium]|nr:fatty acyl-CoA reductase [Ketobacteraceae bacterium]